MNKRERRDHIIECAKLIFVEKGFHNSSVADIIEKARIARSTFYAHFTGKDDIFAILVDSFAETLRKSILAINISRAGSGNDLASEIKSMTLDLVGVLEDNADLAKLLITAPQGHGTLFDRKVSDFYSGILRAIRQLLDEGIADGNVTPLDTGIIAYAILGCVKQVLLQWMVYGEIPDIRDALDHIIRYNLHGIAVRAGSRLDEPAKA